MHAKPLFIMYLNYFYSFCCCCFNSINYSSQYLIFLILSFLVIKIQLIPILPYFSLPDSSQWKKEKKKSNLHVACFFSACEICLWQINKKKKKKLSKIFNMFFIFNLQAMESEATPFSKTKTFHHIYVLLEWGIDFKPIRWKTVKYV